MSRTRRIIRTGGRCCVVLLLLWWIPGWPEAASGDPDHAKYGPVHGPIAVPLSQSSAYFRDVNHPAADFWRLMPYYVSQITGGSCSVASVAMVVNGFARSGRMLRDEDTIVTQTDLLDRVRRHPWKSKRGLSLGRLEAVLKESLGLYGVLNAGTQMVQTTENTPQNLDEFRKVLESNERSADDFVIVHYLQDIVTRSPGGPYPHISPVGAYDIESRRVLILDVDRKWYEPYWVPDHMLFEAMSGRTRAFGHGGYIRVWANPRGGIVSRPKNRITDPEAGRR